MAAKKREIGNAIKSLNLAQPFKLQDPNGIGLKPKQPEIIIPIAQTEVPHFEAPPEEPPPTANTKIRKKEKPKAEAGSGFSKESALPFEIEGYFKIPHGMFSDDVIRNLSGDCFRLFLWLHSRAWRFQDSNGVLRASISFIELCTGVGHAAVSRSLKTLKEASLVELVESNFKHGNLWRVKCLGTGLRASSKKVTQKEVAPLKGEVTRKEGSSSPVLREKPPQFEGHTKNSIIPKNPKNSLSSDFPDSIANYFKNLPIGKQVSERDFFESLQKQYTDVQIGNCLDHVSKTAEPTTGRTIHSPMAYLSKAIGNILPEVEKRLREQVLRRERELRAAEEAAEQDRQAERDQRAFELKEKAFEAAFPTIEIQAVELKKHIPALGMLNANGRMARNLGISKWWDATHEKDAVELIAISKWSANQGGTQ